MKYSRELENMTKQT